MQFREYVLGKMIGHSAATRDSSTQIFNLNPYICGNDAAGRDPTPKVLTRRKAVNQEKDGYMKKRMMSIMPRTNWFLVALSQITSGCQKAQLRSMRKN